MDRSVFHATYHAGSDVCWERAGGPDMRHRLHLDIFDNLKSGRRWIGEAKVRRYYKTMQQAQHDLSRAALIYAKE
mgnify:FL=1